MIISDYNTIDFIFEFCGFRYNTKYNDDKAFDNENIKYIDKSGEDCKQNYYKYKEKNDEFIKKIIIGHSNPYTTMSEFQTACSSVMKTFNNIIAEQEKNGVTDNGLIPYKHYHSAKVAEENIKMQLQNLQQNSVEEIYKNQKAVIEALESSNDDIYIGKNGSIVPIKVLAVRGDSFIKMGHDWCRFILDDEFKNQNDIPIEFILGSEEDDDLIKNRYFAFKNKSRITDEDYKSFSERYKSEMKQIHSVILADKRCTLFLHNQVHLPFRMIFIGKYLYLSVFLNDKKAAESPVMKIRSGSSLYQVCEEYYSWVKESSKTTSKV